MTTLPERHESLWMLTVAPSIWAAHFLLSYVSAAVWCAKLGDVPLGGVRLVIAVYTVLALAAIVMTGIAGYRRHGGGFDWKAHEHDTDVDRHQFLGIATLLLAGLSGVAVVFSGLPAVFIASCR